VNTALDLLNDLRTGNVLNLILNDVLSDSNEFIVPRHIHEDIHDYILEEIMGKVENKKINN
jgi:hypothetical protein